MRSSATIVVAAVLLLAACGGGDDGDTVAAGEAPVSEEEWRALPLAQAMGWDELGPGSEEEWEAQEREVQELTAECMAALGFEYQPVDYGGGISFDPYAELDVEPGSREFAEQYGLGMMTFFEQEQEAFGPGIEEDFVDPNQEYVESLSDGERDAYFQALHGDFPEIDESLSEEEMNEIWEDFVPTGCESEAQREVFGAGFFGPGDQSETVQEFWELQEELFQRIEADPRIVDLRTEWQACMSEAGHDFTDEQDMYESLNERTNEFYESMSYPGDDLTPAEWEAMSEDELEALYSQPPEFDRALLDELQALEIDIAVAHYDCSEGSQRLRYEVQRELESEFVEQHADLIEEVRGELS